MRIKAIEAEGATVEVVPGDYDNAVARSAEAVGPRSVLVSDTSWPGYVDTPGRVIEGYATIFAEVDDAVARLGLAPDVVVVPIGVGALAAAAVRHYRQFHAPPGPVLVGVEPDDANCVCRSLQAGRRLAVRGPHRTMMVGLNCGTPSLVAWPLMSAGLDWCVSVGDDDAAGAMRRLAGEGIVSGETGAAALAGLEGLVDWAEASGRRSDAGVTAGATVLVLSTEGATDPANYRAVVGRPAPWPSPSA